MSVKNNARLRRARRGRNKMRELGANRLSVYRSSQHIYAQVFTSEGDKVLATASTVEKDLRGETGSNISAQKKSVSLLLSVLKLQALRKLLLIVVVINITAVLKR
jgi:large subunit ribosomal protein L18